MLQWVSSGAHEYVGLEVLLPIHRELTSYAKNIHLNFLESKWIKMRRSQLVILTSSHKKANWLLHMSITPRKRV
jgi:hypothetical protein